MRYTNVNRTGSKMGFRGYDESGDRIHINDEFYPTLYTETKKKTNFKSVSGFPLDPVKPGTMWDCKNYIEKWDNVDGYTLHGQDNWVSQYLSDKYLESGGCSYEFSGLNSAYIDIECESERSFPDATDARERINAITTRSSKSGKTYVLGLGNFHIPDTEDRSYTCMEFTEESELLKTFIELWRQEDYDIVSGWNISGYDIPYIINRVNRVLGEDYSKALSPWGSIYAKNVIDDYGNTRQTYKIHGIAILDFMQLYKKYVLKPRESYKLDFIAEAELGHKKVDWKSKYDSMSEFYKKNFQLFMEYNAVDVDLVYEMETKLCLLELQTQIAYTALINYEDVFSPVRTWDSIIYNHLRERGIIIPLNLSSFSKDSQYAGAYVKDPVPGMYNYVASFDVNSLYPNIIAGKNISPDTLVTRGNLEGFRKRILERLSNV